MITVLSDPESLSLGHLEITGDAYRHLFRARRVAVGEAIRVVDGAGRARLGRVTAVDRAVGHVELSEDAPANEPPLRVELFCPLPKPERASWLVEKATEIGLTAIRFFSSERAPRSAGPGTLARLRRVAAAAVEQCHRARVPELSGIHAWHELPALVRQCGSGFVLDPRGPAGAPLPRAAPGATSVAVVAGPEGGWASDELATLAELGCAPLRLGARILRTETAAVVGAGLLLSGID